MSDWHGTRRRSPSPRDSPRPRPRRRSPSPSSSVLPPLHWPRDASPVVEQRRFYAEGSFHQASSHRQQRERSRRRSPPPPSRTRLDSPRTTAHTHDSEYRSHDIDDYDPPIRRRRSHSPRPPTHSSRRRSSRSRSPRRSGPHGAQALDDRDLNNRDGDGYPRAAGYAPLSGWDAAYESIGKRSGAQPALASGSRRSWGGQAGAAGRHSRYEDWDVPRWDGGGGAGRMRYEEENTRRDGMWTGRSAGCVGFPPASS